MKRVFSIALLILSSVSALATVTPNDYVCKGEKVDVYYSRSSFTGEPIFQVVRPKTLRAARYQKMIFDQTSPIGELVWLKFDPAADGPNGTVTLILPKIVLDPVQNGPLTFKTDLVTVSEKSFWGGAENLRGLVENRKTEALECTARLVAF